MPDRPTVPTVITQGMKNDVFLKNLIAAKGIASRIEDMGADRPHLGEKPLTEPLEIRAGCKAARGNEHQLAT